MNAVKTAVFPVAGFGTRFLPATKATPKVLLPIVDRPLIQYAVDEAEAAGIENLVFVTGRGNSAIEDYFDVSFELESTLHDQGKDTVVTSLKGLRRAPGQIVYVRQIEPLGLGHAVWCARNAIGNEPFAVLLADELILSGSGNLTAMLRTHERHGGNVVLVDEVPSDQTHNYGIIEPGQSKDGATEIVDIVEKPEQGTAPSNLAVIGRYILEPSVMDTLGALEPGAGNEIQLTDALLAGIGILPFHAVHNQGDRFDCGSKEGFVAATIHAALQRSDLRDSVISTINAVSDSDLTK